MAIATYKFNENIIKTSINKSLEESKKEWEFFVQENSDDKKTCICQHKIKRVNYFFNIYNGNIICCGSVCCKKFNFEKNLMKNKILEQILKLKKFSGEYNNISNIKEYLEYSKNELTIFLNNKIKLAKFNSLIILLNDIQNIKNLYDLEFFNNSIEIIKNKIFEEMPGYIKKNIFENILTIETIFHSINELIIKYNFDALLINFNFTDYIKETILELVEIRINNYTGIQASELENKLKKNINVEALSHLKEFFIEMLKKLKIKINSVIAQNFIIDKNAYERKINKTSYCTNNKKYF